MNREAAALGVPVYSIFRGKIGAVDRQLQREGRMVMIEKIEDVHKKVCLEARNKDHRPENRPRRALQDIVDHVEKIIRIENSPVSSGKPSVGKPAPSFIK
jgi:predicted glycosyltransferase